MSLNCKEKKKKKCAVFLKWISNLEPEDYKITAEDLRQCLGKRV